LFYVVGVPGSGKTFWAISYLSKKCDSYDFVYHNISGLKSDCFDCARTLFSKFDFSLFLSNVSKLYSAHSAGSSDEDLIALSKSLGLFNSLLIVDECHNYLDNFNKALVWFFTYHRHFNIDIILITQNLSLVHYKYKPPAEFFIRATPSTLRFFSNVFRYTYYTSSRMYKNDKAKVEKIRVNSSLFKCYHSGFKLNAKSFVHRYFFLFLFLLIFVFLVFYFFLSHFFFSSSSVSSSAPASVHYVQSSSSSSSSVTSSVIFSDSDVPPSLVSVLCIDSTLYCYVGPYELPFSFLTSFSDTRIVSFNDVAPDYTSYVFYSSNSDFLALFSSSSSAFSSSSASFSFLPFSR